MKNKLPLLFVLLILTLGMCSCDNDNSPDLLEATMLKQNVDNYDVVVSLPEEHMLITPESNLKGYYTGDVLNIEFDNAPKVLEIYTQKDIYYVDVNNLSVTHEGDEDVKRFDSFEHLSKYISDITSKE